MVTRDELSMRLEKMARARRVTQIQKTELRRILRILMSHNGTSFAETRDNIAYYLRVMQDSYPKVHLSPIINELTRTHSEIAAY